MAKVFRVFGYLVSPNSDECNGTKEDVLSELYAIEPTYPVFWNGLQVEEKDLGEWTDEHPLNKSDCPAWSASKYFEETEQYMAPALEIRKVYNSYLEVGFDEDQAMRLTESYIRIAFEKVAQGMYQRPQRVSKSELFRRMHEKRVRMGEEDPNDLPPV